MSKKFISYGKSAFILCTLCAHLAVAEESARQLVAKADAFRQPIQEGILTFTTSVHRENEPVVEETNEVKIKGAELSFLLSTKGANKGRKVLMNQENLWVRLPGSSRALRITPMQRLMGDVSYGDLGKLRWSEDYDSVLEKSKEENVDGVPAFQFKLTAIKANSAYPKIDLWLAKDDSRPLLAHFYLGSGKLLKSAKFGPLFLINGKKIVKEITYRDQLHLKSFSLLQLVSFKQQAFSQDYFSIEKFRE